MIHSYTALELAVIQWAEAKGIIAGSDAKTQCLKFMSEAGELADAVAKGSDFDTADAIGDVLVTLIILADLCHLNLVECLQTAYNVISKRSGVMINGVFCKGGVAA